MLYFAYGSNMLTARLRSRCPGAEPMGRATLAHHRVRFAKRGMDGSGKATVLYHQGAVTHGIVYDIPDEEIQWLDAAEGLGKGYGKSDFKVGTSAGLRTAFTYRATTPESGLLPFDWYLALILAACREHDLPADVLGWYQAHAFATDTEAERPGRTQAIETLESSDALDWASAAIGAVGLLLD
ncbi:MAG: gamma-glutamylcyclotransferase family protein [Pseudomonadota bacterium]